jgi:hypothetical protein
LRSINELNFRSAVDAVEGRGNDSTSITGTLTTWVEACNLNVLKGFAVTRDTDWRRRAGLNSEKKSIISIVAVHLLVANLRESILQTERNVLRKQFMKRSIHCTRVI